MPGDWTAIASFGLVSICVVMFVASALHDLAARTIPDGYWAIVAAAGLGLRLLDGTVLLALGLAVVLLAGGCICLRLGKMGGGDVKLIAASALAVPPSLLVSFLMIMAVAGAIVSIPYLVGRWLHRPVPVGRPHRAFARWWRMERKRLRDGVVPYACAIAAGGIFTLL